VNLLITLTTLFIVTSCTPPAKLYRGNFSGSGGGDRIVQTARKFIGVRYRYGGNDPRGFDCSGFSNYVYKKNRIGIPRSATEQFQSGKRVPISRAKPGDLVFFKIYGNKISHVGIYLGNYNFIHSPRRGKTVSCEDMRKEYWRTRYAGTVTYLRK